MGRIVRIRDYVLGKAIDLSYVGQALRAHEAGKSTLEFEWPTSTADMWIDMITSSGLWKIDSIRHPTVWDAETDESVAVVHATFSRVELELAAPMVDSTVPTGWYADPSGRFELRYWGVSGWTEHVSRSGQQFIDPPTA